MSPESALVCGVLFTIVTVIFGLIHKWQAKDFDRGYRMALDHMDHEVHILRTRPELTQRMTYDGRTWLEATGACRNVLVKLRKEIG